MKAKIIVRGLVRKLVFFVNVSVIGFLIPAMATFNIVAEPNWGATPVQQKSNETPSTVAVQTETAPNETVEATPTANQQPFTLLSSAPCASCPKFGETPIELSSVSNPNSLVTLNFQSVFEDAYGSVWMIIGGEKYKVILSSISNEGGDLLAPDGTLWHLDRARGQNGKVVLVVLCVAGALVLIMVGCKAKKSWDNYKSNLSVILSNKEFQMTNLMGLWRHPPPAPITASTFASLDSLGGVATYITNFDEDAQYLEMDVSTNGWTMNGHTVTKTYIMAVYETNLFVDGGMGLKSSRLQTSTDNVHWANYTGVQKTLGWVYGDPGEPADTLLVLYTEGGEAVRTNLIHSTLTATGIISTTLTINGLPRLIGGGGPQRFFRRVVE